MIIRFAVRLATVSSVERPYARLFVSLEAKPILFVNSCLRGL